MIVFVMIMGKNFQLFITLMDKLRLEIKAMDDLHPELRDLCDTMNRLSILPEDFEGKLKVIYFHFYLKYLNIYAITYI